MFKRSFFGLNFYHYFCDTCQYNFCDLLYIFRHVGFLKILLWSRFTVPSQVHRLVPLWWFPRFLNTLLFYVLQSNSLPQCFSRLVTEFVGAGIINYSCPSVAKSGETNYDLSCSFFFHVSNIPIQSKMWKNHKEFFFKLRYIISNAHLCMNATIQVR